MNEYNKIHPNVENLLRDMANAKGIDEEQAIKDYLKLSPKERRSVNKLAFEINETKKLIARRKIENGESTRANLDIADNEDDTTKG